MKVHGKRRSVILSHTQFSITIPQNDGFFNLRNLSPDPRSFFFRAIIPKLSGHVVGVKTDISMDQDSDLGIKSKIVAF